MQSQTAMQKKQEPESNPMKNGQLNFGVVAPPDKLPNASVYNTVYSMETKEPQKEARFQGGNKLTAGKLSAGCKIGSALIALLAIIPFIRKH